MFLFVNMSDVTTGVMRITQLALLALIFVMLPLAGMAALGEIWVRGNPLVLVGIGLTVALFADCVIRKRRQRVLSGLFAFAAIAAGIAHGLDLRHEWNETPVLGSPRTLHWAEGFERITTTYRGSERLVEKMMPADMQDILGRVSVSTSATAPKNQAYRRVENGLGGKITIGKYRLIPADAWDRYAELAQTEGDWLAFTSVCLMKWDCRPDTTPAMRRAAIEERFGIDLRVGLERYFASGASPVAVPRANADYAAVCGEDPLCDAISEKLGLSPKVLFSQ